MRYLKRHDFEPDFLTNTKRPSTSQTLYGFSLTLRFLTLASVSGIILGVRSLSFVQRTPKRTPNLGVRYRMRPNIIGYLVP